MARPPRLVLPGVPLHVIQRGNNRATTFHCPSDFTRFRDGLHDASRRFDCAIHAYVLMPNHIHLLITPDDERGPSRMMQLVTHDYACYANTRYHRTGFFWQGRYRSSLVHSERYLINCSRYIELNPVRARIVDEPSQYRWSSYRQNALGESDPLICPHVLYQELGSSAADRQAAYRALFDRCLTQETITVIRRTTRTGGVLGDDAFQAAVEEQLRCRANRMLHGGDRRSIAFKANQGVSHLDPADRGD